MRRGGMVQASNGTFYGGASNGGPFGAGVIYSLTSSGTYTQLYNLNGSSDGSTIFGQLLAANDGNLYGVTTGGGAFSCGTIFKVTQAGAFSVIHDFDNTHGCNPREQVIQGTNGLLYGLTNSGGAHNVGNFYSLDVSNPAFISLLNTSGRVGSTVQIQGQGFSNASVVKFGGITATTKVLSGTTLIRATLPAGALTGKVTVTTGAVTLTSSQTFSVTPVLSGFSPASGPVGTAVTLTGTGLTQTTTVNFNGKGAVFAVNSDSQVTATVPTGSTTGKINVTTNGGSVSSTTKFIVN